MNNSSQFYFSVEKLEKLIEEFKTLRVEAPEKKILRGFVFTAGAGENNKQCCFAFPLYSDNEKGQAIENGAILLQNLSSDPGCPYPPPCN